jgi:hypothetical protein
LIRQRHSPYQSIRYRIGYRTGTEEEIFYWIFIIFRPVQQQDPRRSNPHCLGLEKITHLLSRHGGYAIVEQCVHPDQATVHAVHMWLFPVFLWGSRLIFFLFVFCCDSVFFWGQKRGWWYDKALTSWRQKKRRILSHQQTILSRSQHRTVLRKLKPRALLARFSSLVCADKTCGQSAENSLGQLPAIHLFLAGLQLYKQHFVNVSRRRQTSEVPRAAH